MVDNKRLALHLPLSRAALDQTGEMPPVVNHNVHVGECYASFNGKDSYLEISSTPAMQLGTGDFSVAVQIWTDERLDGMVGDIVSRFDPASRHGFSLSARSHAGAVTSQTNFRNLQFEADGATEPQWHDYGQVGNAVSVWALAVHRGQLYAGTYEQGPAESGCVYRLAGDQGWKCCGRLDGSNTVSALVEFDGQLYAATKKEDPHGSLLEPTHNNRPGGNVYRLNEDETWTHCGKVSNQDNLFGMAAFRGGLYAWPAYAKGIYRYDGGTKWECIESPDSRLLALAPYHGDLYATANRLALLDPNVTHAGPDGDVSVQPVVGKDGVYRLQPDGRWVGCGYQAAETQIYAMGIYAGQLHVSTWPSGKVFRYQGGGYWHDCGRLGEEDEVMGLAIYNGILYAGTLPSASLFRFDADNRWCRVGCVDDTPGVPLRRAINMAVYRGKLFAGALPSGHVRAMEVGQVASHDWPLPHGWHSIAAVRRAGTLYLYLDAELVAQSRSMSRPLDLSCDRPWHIGFGQHDFFNGRMRDFRLYQRALSDGEIVELSPTPI